MPAQVSKKQPKTSEYAALKGGCAIEHQAKMQLIWNLIKTGSRNLLFLIELLSQQNGFTILTDGVKRKVEVLSMNSTEKQYYIEGFDTLQDFDIALPVTFLDHMNFLDFEEFNKTNPIYINIVRHSEKT